MWRQMAWTVLPAATFIMFEDGVVGLGPPLQATSLVVTSVMG